MKLFKSTFYKKKIIVTGHTGFKGSWLALWLKLLAVQDRSSDKTIKLYYSKP